MSCVAFLIYWVNALQKIYWEFFFFLFSTAILGINLVTVFMAHPVMQFASATGLY